MYERAKRIANIYISLIDKGYYVDILENKHSLSRNMNISHKEVNQIIEHLFNMGYIHIIGNTPQIKQQNTKPSQFKIEVACNLILSNCLASCISNVNAKDLACLTNAIERKFSLGGDALIEAEFGIFLAIVELNSDKSFAKMFESIKEQLKEFLYLRCLNEGFDVFKLDLLYVYLLNSIRVQNEKRALEILQKIISFK